MRSKIVKFLLGLIVIFSFTSCGDVVATTDGENVGGTPSEKVAVLTAPITSLNINVGEVRNITVNAKAEDGSLDNISVFSSDENVIVVQAFQTTVSITAKSVGTATVTVTSASGKSLTISVEVTGSPLVTTSTIPQNVSATDGTYSDKVVVTWDAVAGATGYIIYIDDANGGDTWDNVSTNTYINTDLTSSFLYTYYVKAIVDGSISDASQTDTGYVSGYTGSGVIVTNNAPIISTITNQTSDVNVAVANIVVSASDIDGDPLTYSATGLPTGLNIDASTGVISGTPISAGISSVTVIVDDGTDVATTSFTYTINTFNENPSGSSNNSSEDAVILTLGTAVSDVVGDLNDWYKFDAVIGNVYEVKFNKFIDDGGVDLEFYTDPTAYQDFSMDVDTNDLNETKMIEFQATATTYYVKVLNHYYGNSTMDVDSLRYELNITTAANDDTSANALAISLDNNYSNILNSTIDNTDWLKINVNANVEYNITSSMGGSSDISLYYGSDLNYVVENHSYSYTSSSNTLSVTPTSNDILFIKFLTRSSYASYWLNITADIQNTATNPTLSLDKLTLDINESTTGTITATATTDGTTADTISSVASSDEAVSTVAVSGDTITVTGTSAGTATVTVTSGSGQTETFTVTVSVSAPAITITHNGVSYGEVTSPATGRVWLDRNLGAAEVCTAFDDVNCRGDYYQWGRLTDGHEDVNSTVGTFDFSHDTDINNAGSEFIYSNDDWTTRDDNGSLRSANWNKTDGSSVCPVGFKVPSMTELEAEKADISFLKAPSASTRSTIGVDQYFLGYNNSHLWSSTPTVGDINSGTQYGKFLGTVDDVNGTIYDGSRLDGHQVRCIKSDEHDVAVPVELNSFSLTYGSYMTLTPDATKMLIVDRDDGAKIYNTSDLISSSAQALSTYDLGDYLSGAAISSDNSKMYLVGYDTGMDIVDISDSANPTKIGSTFNDEISYYLGVTLSPNGNIVYISNRYNGILTVDVSGDTPTQLGSYDTDGAAFYSVISSDGNTLYVADETNGLVVLNVSDPANPTLINSLHTDGKAYKMTLSNDNSKLYLADNVGGLKIVDVSNVTTSNAPTLLGTILPGNAKYVNNVTLNSAETMAFLACSDGGATGDDNADGLYVIDITNPNSPTLKTSQVSLNGSGSSVVLSKDESIVYLLSGNGFNAYSMEGLLAK